MDTNTFSYNLIQNQNHTPFFILGRERSGTTMLRIALNGHSKIYIPPESTFILNLLNKHKNKLNTSKLISDLKLDPYLKAWVINYDELLVDLNSITTPTYQAFCWTILGHMNKKAKLLGDKNPTYALFGKKIIELYPDAKIIWLIRDYRSQVNSMLKVNFEKKDVASLTVRWAVYNQHIHQLELDIPNQVLRIRYEDLVESSEASYTKICSFLGLKYEDTMLSWNKKNEEFHSAHHQSLSEKPTTKHIAEWKKELSIKQVRICQTIAGVYGEQLGYQKIDVASYPVFIMLFKSILYGRAYIPFIKLMYALPFSWRKALQKRVIEPNSKFWKEINQELEN